MTKIHPSQIAPAIITDATTARTLSVADTGGVLQFTSADAVALTLPPDATADLAPGVPTFVIQKGAGVVTATPGAGVTLNGSVLATAGEGTALVLVKVGPNEWDALSGGAAEPVPLSYADVVLADSPLAYYQLNEESGAVMADSSGNGYDGTLNNVTFGRAPLVAGGGSGIRFSTPTSYGEVSPDPAFDNIVCVEMWVRLAASSRGNQRGFVSRAALGNSSSRWVMGANDPDNAPWRWDGYRDGGAARSTSGAGEAFGADEIHHVVFQYEAAAGGLRIYVDGAEISDYTTLGTGTPFSSGGGLPLWVGRLTFNDSLDFSAEGDVGHVALYTSELTPAQIATHYAAGAAE